MHVSLTYLFPEVYGPMSCPMNKKAWYESTIWYFRKYFRTSVRKYESTRVQYFRTNFRTNKWIPSYVVTLWYTNCTRTVHVGLLISFDERRISLSFPQCTVTVCVLAYLRTCNSGSIHAGLARLPETGHQPVSQQLPSVHLYNKSVDKIARAVYFKKLVN